MVLESSGGQSGGPQLMAQYTVLDEDVVRGAVIEERELEQKAKNDNNGRGSGGSNGPSGGNDGRGNALAAMRHASHGGANAAPVDDEVRFEELAVLRLSYKNILRIDNLVGLQALTTLCLDNNVIEEIENLGHLVTLRWLDLSFNNISCIKGLETLTELQDLSLYANNIESLENLEKCTKLECLSVGSNKINKLENLLYLRQFKKLRLVTLEGNPVCNDPEYRMFVLAYLDRLKYFDYALIEANEVVSAREQFQDELLEAQERDQLEEVNEKAAAQQREYLARLKTAGLEIVETLFDDMFREDKELPKLKLLPGFDSIFESYQHEYRVQSEATVNIGLEFFQKYLAERERMEVALEKITDANEARSIEMVEAFFKALKQATVRLQDLQEKQRHGEDNPEELRGITAEVNRLSRRRLDLREDLMTIETEQTQQLKQLLDVYENRAGAIRTERIDHATLFFRAVEDLENSFATALEELAVDLVEKLANNLLEDLNDETMAFLSDRDNLLVAIQGAHDVHLGKLLAQEDALREGLLRELNDKVANLKKSFSKQNRDRVFEVARMQESIKEELEALEQRLASHDGDD
ncbi:Dynein regulatory complex subunit 3 [Hondaea fermentalgiana]|uniref:Dynein regulatory complex subunit 3 n=1 Tax=Hondaea fermentalgiana TaxID=2315210 RepID=A0A2R5GLX3_9STRA|nr:Dynein regulatory complex subunit 3 [Hondaea fermentalgiana]|eukprot:GBG31896.1 Dynein regulatory complex subunit 3 [Hondaea fermentalgiana]